MAAPHGLDLKISLPKYKKALKTTPATNGNQFQLRNLDKNAPNYNNLHSPSKRTQSKLLNSHLKYELVNIA